MWHQLKWCVAPFALQRDANGTNANNCKIALLLSTPNEDSLKTVLTKMPGLRKFPF